MIEQLRTLAKMQSFDDKIGQFRDIQKELPKQLLEIEEKTVQATADLLAGEKEKAELNAEQSALESNIKAAQSLITKYSNQLTDTKTNKEYKALNSEMTHQKEKIQKFESQMLELMDKENGIKEKVASLKAVHDEIDGEKRKMEAEIKAQNDELEAKIEELRSERNKLAVTLPNTLIKRYGGLIKNKDNLAVTYNQNGSCSGCGFVIRQQMRIELQLKKKLVYCENCGRIILDSLDI
ncbi:MAG: C4-type zinc ribbon domain-containing protein [Candidatus Cloacimonetes bacterium]|nr:C4-type zinc ribbon domain-containing protein [Candidatus Cloacimonadota bacterium]